MLGTMIRNMRSVGVHVYDHMLVVRNKSYTTLMKIEWWNHEFPEIGFSFRLDASYREGASLELFALNRAAHVWLSYIPKRLRAHIEQLVSSSDLCSDLDLSSNELSVRLFSVEDDPLHLICKRGDDEFRLSFNDWYMTYQGESTHKSDVTVNLPEGPYYWEKVVFEDKWKTRLGFTRAYYTTMLTAKPGEDIPVPPPQGNPFDPSNKCEFISQHVSKSDELDDMPDTLYTLIGRVIHRRASVPAYTGTGKYSRPINEA